MHRHFRKLNTPVVRAAVTLACLLVCGMHFDLAAQVGATEPAPKAAPAPEKATPENFVDALNSAFGKQTTNRAVHAKGIVLSGRFTPSANAQNFSKAPHFKHAVPITVRFSNNTGLPKLPDADPLASPHGLAIKFHLPDGSDTDLVTHSYNGFPTSNADDLRLLFLAVGQSGPGVASPTPLEKFLADHPTAKTFLTSQDPPPTSFATTSYFGVNSFKFTNAQGKSAFARYQLLPEAGRHFLSKEEAGKTSPDYLMDEIIHRIGQSPVRFKLVVQLASTGDKIDDPSIAWADTNKTLELGVLEITSAVPDSETAEKALLFLPGRLPVGIEPADPMIEFRTKTYPVSFARRHQQ